VGSSWDPTAAARLGTALGREAVVHGVAVVLGPGVDITRSPLYGRTFEYYSEDPHLSGVLGAAFTRVLQARPGPSAPTPDFMTASYHSMRGGRLDWLPTG
jgi:beta-glucosidase